MGPQATAAPLAQPGPDPLAVHRMQTSSNSIKPHPSAGRRHRALLVLGGGVLAAAGLVRVVAAVVADARRGAPVEPAPALLALVAASVCSALGWLVLGVAARGARPACRAPSAGWHGAPRPPSARSWCAGSRPSCSGSGWARRSASAPSLATPGGVVAGVGGARRAEHPRPAARPGLDPAPRPRVDAHRPPGQAPARRRGAGRPGHARTAARRRGRRPARRLAVEHRRPPPRRGRHRHRGRRWPGRAGTPPTARSSAPTPTCSCPGRSSRSPGRCPS